ncbi:lysine-N-methylase [Mixta theicola]|uniref:Lysine-N-methylase n=1 Tax=Mixta theicola TaxID=1458355 RepID=A0A2K1Q7F7_9GAMM|nr:flagellin lysine-N-methylase [Mixta theicola]PNS10975.1 lysine-N-methylase [Mixta theicola]GLR08314.1 lysine-N-methylase [Mixta theicola]
MKIHKIITPNFYKKFKCAGSECLNDCCHGWNIYIDKKTHEKYINSPDEEIKTIAKSSLKLAKGGKNKYSIIHFDENGKCPFFTADKLCKIHQKMGGDSLSNTCAGYPRRTDSWGDQLRHNMTMSCSEVVRLVLFEQESMLQHEETNLIATAAKTTLASRHILGQKNQLIHLFAWNLIAAQSSSIEANLLALAQFILYLQRINFDLSGRLSEAEAFYEELIVALNRGQLVANSNTNEQSALLKLRAVMAIFKDNINTTVRNYSLRDNYILIADYLSGAETADIAAMQAKFTEINQQWQQLCTVSCLKEPYVMRNYLHYQLYSSWFPGKDLALIMRKFYRIVMDYFFLKFSLAVKSLQQEIKQDDVVELFADYYQYINHSSSMADKLDKAIDEINGGDDLSCLLLLG